MSYHLQNPVFLLESWNFDPYTIERETFPDLKDCKVTFDIKPVTVPGLNIVYADHWANVTMENVTFEGKETFFWKQVFCFVLNKVAVGSCSDVF